MQRSGQAADREDIEMQAESKGSPGKHREPEHRGTAQNVSRAKQDFTVSARK